MDTKSLESSRKLSELVSKFSKTANYKFNAERQSTTLDTISLRYLSNKEFRIYRELKQFNTNKPIKRQHH